MYIYMFVQFLGPQRLALPWFFQSTTTYHSHMTHSVKIGFCKDNTHIPIQRIPSALLR